MSIKKWALKKPISKKIAENLKNYPELTQKLLFYRGIKTIEEAEIYLNPNFERDVLDPFLFADMDKAVDRIIEAIHKKEKIIIFGDYDADGVPGAAILASFFERIGYSDFDVYIPDRHLEAYGLSEKSVKQFIADKIDLVITVDCGVTNNEDIALAKENGLDVIVTDHHLTGETLPDAVAIVDAKRIDDKYPFKSLAGSGVAFKLVCAILTRDRFNVPVGWEKWLLDLVAIATVSDMVPLVGENRVLTYFGLKVLRQTRRLGMIALLHELKIKPENVMEDDIGFMIGPRLNSAGRMSHASQAYFLLQTKDGIEAVTIAKHLEEKNKERKDSVDVILRGAEEKLLGKNLPPVIVVGSVDWSLGVLGLTSSRLVEKYNRPVFLWGKNGNGEIKGSCRSDGTVNLVELMKEAGGEDYFINFGGHIMAGGFSITEDKVGELAERINKAYEKIEKKDVAVSIEVDEQLSLDEVTWDNYYQVEKLGPFGIENTKPVFLLAGVDIFSAKTFGNGGIHLELAFKNSKGKVIPAIGFFVCPPSLVGENFDGQNGHHFPEVNLTAGQKVDILVNLEKSTFKNFPELRMRIVDIKKVHPVK